MWDLDSNKGDNAECPRNRQYLEMPEVVEYIYVMNTIESRMSSGWVTHGKPPRCLSLLNYSTGSLAHLPINIRDLDVHSLIAQNRAEWTKKIR